MKKSEFIKRHIRGGTADHEKEAEMAATLAEEAGVEWDAEVLSPEELSRRCGKARWNLLPRNEGEWIAGLYGFEVALAGGDDAYRGVGSTPQEAMEDYCRRVAGKVLVSGSYETSRRVYDLSQAEKGDE